VTLTEHLGASERRPRVIQDCVFLIEEEVKRKSGLSGIAIKAAFATVKTVKPGFIAEAVDTLLDDFARRLDPFFQRHRSGTDAAAAPGRALPDFFIGESAAIADALLGITDERAQRAKHAMVKKSYEKLRPSAKKHVEEAVPAIGRLIEKHTAQAVS
jgi:hypothetical protein